MMTVALGESLTSSTNSRSAVTIAAVICLCLKGNASC